MKNFLLGALLIVGSSAFGAVAMPVTGSGSSGTGTAKLPVKVVGTVIDTATTTTMVITPLKNAGVNGNTMEFEFGDLVEDQTQQLEGTYKIELRKNGTITAFTQPPTVTLEGGTSVGSGNKATSTIGIGSGTDDVALAYTLGALSIQGDKTYIGNLTVDAKVKDGANTGTFIDRSVGIKVEVTGQTMS